MHPARVKRARALILNKLPRVTWDRCISWDRQMVAYGWIPRADGRADFVQVAFLWPDDPGASMLTTSSAEHSAEMTEALYGPGEHTDCERVEDVFCELVKYVTAAA